MKTSTKLLIIFFSCIPISLVAYNVLLRNEFKRGDFTRDYYLDESNTLARQKMAPFKHIVIIGFGGTIQRRSITYWRPRISIGNFINIGSADHQPGNYVNVIKQYKENVKATVKNDTLFISFEIMTKHSNLGDFNDYAPSGNLVEIEGDHVLSVNANSADVMIRDKPSNIDSLNFIVTGGGHYDINNLDVNKLSLAAKDSSYFAIYKNNKIKSLNYSLLDKSRLNLEEHPVQQFYAGKVDGTATMEITDKASYLQKQLH
jgi:hypothetical protein